MNDENLAKLGLNKASLVEKRGSEAGNTFHLESKYTDALDVYYTDEDGSKKSIIMGCYGIGISRLMGIIAEIFSDDKGLAWPESIAPFKVYLVRIGGDEAVKCADGLYDELISKGIEVLYDDRDAHPGQKFTDSELIGVPYRITISDRMINDNTYEIVERKTGQKNLLTRQQLLDKLVKL